MPLRTQRALPFLRGLLADGAMRYAIKFGMAGTLAVFIALAIRLKEPVWALFTVFVLMIAQYVGAIAEKSVFRLIGTVIGGVLGYLLTASLEQQPWLFLPLVGIIVAFCVAMFGQARYPYAFLLCGMTIVVVSSNGLGNPDNSWQYMLFRIEEVTLGILVAVFIQSVVWPRYARMEFSVNMRSAFDDLKDCFVAGTSSFLGGPVHPEANAEDFPARISALRGLLDFGARESQFFRNRLTTYFEITGCLSRIASAIVTIGNPLPETSVYVTIIKSEGEALHKTITAALDDLASDSSTQANRLVHREAMDAAVKNFNQRFLELRSLPGMVDVPAEEVMSLGVHALALDEICVQIKRAHELIDSLPLEMGSWSREPEPYVSPIPPPFWIRTGIKSGIAVVVALVIYNWLKPPGGTMFVLGAWVFTALDATSPGGQGDRRTFHYLVYSIFALLALSLVLLLIRPMLSSYAVLNTIIFAWLFVWGYLSYSSRGMTIPMQMGMLCIVGIVALNGQEPISFQGIVGYFFGLALAVIVASVIQRLIWPSLPQWELRDRFVEFLQTCSRILQEGPASLPLWQKTRLALIPGEARLRISVLHPPICPAGEPDRLRDYLKTLQRVGSHLLVTVGRLAPLLPTEHAERGKTLIADFEQVLRQQILAHETSARDSTVIHVDAEALSHMMEKWSSWVHDLRSWMLAHKHPVEDALRILGLAGRYEEAARDVQIANEQALRLRSALYMGDYVL